MAFKMSGEARQVRVYNLLADTREFIGEGDAYIPPHTGLPANCTDIPPPAAEAGKVPVFNSDKQQWNMVEDHRGETVYSTSTGEAIFITAPGALPDNVTKKTPRGEFQRWDNGEWVPDPEAEENYRIQEIKKHKDELMVHANARITPLQDAVDLDMATEREKTLLNEWKKYRVLLNRVEVSAPIWPETPGDVA
ncbi:tail fiber assembly protein [Cronobacter dublinensis]